MAEDRIFQEGSWGVGSFVFDQRVAAVFDDMVSRSVPGYEAIQLIVADLALKFYRQNWIYDLGCSTGTTIRTLCKRTNQKLRAVGVDTSEAMLAECAEKLREFRTAHELVVKNCDIGASELFEEGPADVIILNLVLQFLRPHLREEILRHAHHHLVPGGCILLVEKTVHSDELFNALFIDYYHSYKREMGYSELEISRKREALENRLIPSFREENLEILHHAGFQRATSFFQWMNFTGFLAVKNHSP